MPPKPKFTKEEVTAAAYEIMKERGIDAVVAREVGKRLGTTAGPIFTYYEGMDELKAAVYHLAGIDCAAYLSGCVDYEPAFKEFGLRWIRYSIDNPHAYKLLFLNDGGLNLQTGMFANELSELLHYMESEVAFSFGVSIEQAEKLIYAMCIYAQGIAAMMLNNVTTFSEVEYNGMISRMCLSYVAGCRIQNGTLNEEQIKMMLDHSSDHTNKIK